MRGARCVACVRSSGCMRVRGLIQAWYTQQQPASHLTVDPRRVRGAVNRIVLLLMHDPAFVRVPEAFRIAIANAAREIASEQMLAAARKPGTQPRRSG